MRRQLLVLGAAIVALVGIAAVASADEPDSFQHGFTFFFGDCEQVATVEASIGSLNGCHGFGLFFGLWDEETMSHEIAYQAAHEFGGEWQTVKLKAINLAHPNSTIFGIEEDYQCTGNSSVTAAQSIPAGDLWGIWIAYFQVEPCNFVE
jgi:hypothetical protein